jgi:N-alpha-acetyltransferase 40
MSDPEILLRIANSLTDLVGVCKLSTEMASSNSESMEKFKLRSYTTEMALSPTQKGEIFDMFEHNMREQYVQNWGWHENEKRKELFHPMSRFLCWYPEGGEGTEGEAPSAPMAAYAIFRFEWDDNDEPEFPVLYCYELMVSAAKQRHGLGSNLIAQLITLARKLKMDKIMVTCFNSNTDAMGFYKKTGFVVDENSPSVNGFPSDYEVLSISVK